MDYETLCIPHRQDLLNLATRYTGSKQTGEDLVQETFLRAYGAWSSFKPTSEDSSRDARVWLRRILSNIFYTQCLRDKREHAGMDVFADESKLVDSEDTSFTPKVQELISELKPMYRDVVERHYIKGESYQEIADALNIPFTMAQKRLYRARQYLKKTMLKTGLVNEAATKALTKEPGRGSIEADGSQTESELPGRVCQQAPSTPARV